MQITTPDWVKNAVFYQIFPDRFAKGQRVQLAQQLGIREPEGWELPPSLQGYKGGDLWGVGDRLDYLKELGINAIYFTPIFQSASNHRYHTHDYYQVDPLLGGNEALKDLLDAAHERDIRVVLDGVFNHASRGFFFFHDILENGSHSPWLDWFRVIDFPLSPYDSSKPANYIGWADNRALPVFNHDNPAVREYLMRVAEYWMRFGIDGWRLDVPFEIQVPGFWEEFRDRVKAINPDAYIVGEVWTDARQWLDGSQFDGVMNYLFTAPVIAFTAGDRVDLSQVEAQSYEPYPALDAPGYAAKIEALLQLYLWEIQLTQLNLLDSHDTARLLTIAQDDAASVALATLLLFTFPGAPSIYYGDEVGLAGAVDPDSRRGFPREENWDRSVQGYHRKLIALRHDQPALRTGSYQTLYAEGMVYGFGRSLQEEGLIVLINAGTEPAQVTLDLTDHPFAHRPQQLLYGQGEATWQGSILSVSLPPRQGMVLGK